MTKERRAKAGWYPDPQHPGQERYWDGEAWGNARRQTNTGEVRTPPPAEIPTAGWYDDPTMTNTRRYWDGKKWTEHRQEKSATPPTSSKTALVDRLRGGGTVATVARVVVAILVAGLCVRLVLFVVDQLQGESVDGFFMELDIESGLSEQGVKGADVSCESVDHVEQGDVTICDGTDAEGNDISVEVTFNSDGSYVWRRQ